MIYKKFATVYDIMHADQHSINMTKYCQKIFKKFKIKPASGLDLCCGTGSALNILSDAGIKMSGLDQSAEMLAIAAKKLKNKKIKLYQKSLPLFKLLDNTDSKKIVQFDLITSFYDSLNYMQSEKDLFTAFQSVQKHLQPGGWFIFDMNTPKALKTIWDEQTYAGVKESMAWVWQNEYNPERKQAACHATFFNKKGKVWERFDETHIETGYTNTVIKSLLKKAGFRIKGYYNCLTFEKPDRDCYRICGVVQKIS